MAKPTLAEYVIRKRGRKPSHVFWELTGMSSSRGYLIEHGGGITPNEVRLLANYLETTPERLTELVIMPGEDVTELPRNRFEVAQRALADGKSLEEAAEIAGYQSAKKLEVVFNNLRKPRKAATSTGQM